MSETSVGILYKSWAAGFIGFAAVWAIVVLLMIATGSDLNTLALGLTAGIAAILAFAVVLGVLKKRL